MCKKRSTAVNIESILGLTPLAGIGSILNIAGDFSLNDNHSIAGYLSDNDSLANDFNLIGDDLNSSFANIQKHDIGILS